MKNKLIALLIIFNNLFINCSNNKNETEFILYGNLLESNAKKIILIYRDMNHNLVLDTLVVSNNRFFTKGLTNVASKAILKLDMANVSGKESNNRIDFFIEPNKIDISVTENKFKEAKINGSRTQVENEYLQKLVEPRYLEIEQLMIERTGLEKKKTHTKDSITIINQIKRIDSDWTKILDEIHAVKLKFAWDNPNSYLSTFIVDQYFVKISFDSISRYYNNFNGELKNSYYGKRISDKIKKRKPTKIGDIAPSFEKVDLTGNNIKLEQFKGKYILLDFWASWCVPCREGNPYLREVYKKYHAKGFEIISISLDDNKVNWKDAITKDSIDDWHHINTGRNGLISIKYNIRLIPDYILIDKNGFIINRRSSNGEFDIYELEKKLEEIFNNN